VAVFVKCGGVPAEVDNKLTYRMAEDDLKDLSFLK